MSCMNPLSNMKHFVYILKCANGQFYVGCTKDLDERMERHNSGRGARFTKKHLPFELVYTEEYENEEDAYNRERQLHKWSHVKKEALINGTL